MSVMRYLFFVCVVLLITPAAAAPPYDLALPVDCDPGADCWVLGHVDHMDGPGVRDYACGEITRDGHKGTDFAIRDLAVMARGVEVRAAAAGVVDALRDGVPDASVEDIGRGAVAGRECGNAVRLDHGDGWTTWYCHMRRGSIRVEQGDRVETGHVLGLVGLSGDTSFPHLHFDLRHGERIVDPFVGLHRERSCRPGERPFWSRAVAVRLDYQPLLLINAGFATAAVEKEDVRAGHHHETRLPATSPALVLWAESYWVKAGDRLRFRLEDPAKRTLLDQTMEIERDRARFVGYAGKARPADRWPAGVYRGEITLERGKTAAVQRKVLEREVIVR